MNILFVHQGFPGQYRHVLRALASQGGHCLVGLGVSELTEAIPSCVNYYRYGLQRGNTPNIHDWLVDFDSKLIRGEACAEAAFNLSLRGFVPDLICAHPGWGEALFLRDIWPTVPLLCYQEFFYNPIGFDYDFDSEIQGQLDWKDFAYLRVKNANPLLMLNSSSWNISPTFFQRSTFPCEYHNRISVIHDGIDTDLASPDPKLDSLVLPDRSLLSRNDTIITFVNRCIEPYRGCHTFIRSIPEIQASYPTAHIVIVGSTSGSSYGKSALGGSWGDIFLKEIQGNYDPSFVHFTGSLSYVNYLSLLKLSSCHVYLTYPFVLSWSLLEAMSLSLPIVASDTAPVKEIITDGQHGLLVDFFSPASLAHSVCTILSDPALALHLGANARSLIVNNYSLECCVPRQLALMQLLCKHSLC